MEKRLIKTIFPQMEKSPAIIPLFFMVQKNGQMALLGLHLSF